MQKKLESQFVRLVMPDAAEDEIEEATRRWFAFLLTIDRIISDGEKTRRDSLNSDPDGTVEAITHNL